MTFGRERYAPIPGETADGAKSMQIQASFAWREIPRDRLTLGKVLGEGEFGMVVKGELTEDGGHVTSCAVKKLKRMLIELILTPVAVAFLWQMRHRHIIYCADSESKLVKRHSHNIKCEFYKSKFFLTEN